jgi:cytoskeletal protein RodZ
VGRTLSRVAGVVFAGALATFAAAPAALAQDETSTSPTETSTSTSEPTTTTAPTTTETTAPSTPVTTTGTTTPSTTEALKTAAPETTTATTTSISAASEPPKDDYQDNSGAGFVGLGGEGVLVIACASGAPGNVATQYLSVTGGPDQDEADGRYWNYSVRVVDAPAGTTTAKFSWTCGKQEGNGVVEFEQEEPPPSTTTSSASPSSTAPITTAPVTTATSAAAGNSAPKAQVKVAPKGGVETGFGGTAW